MNFVLHLFLILLKCQRLAKVFYKNDKYYTTAILNGYADGISIHGVVTEVHDILGYKNKTLIKIWGYIYATLFGIKELRITNYKIRGYTAEIKILIGTVLLMIVFYKILYKLMT